MSALGAKALPVRGDIVANRYRIDHALGQGGMGAAFAATNLVTQKRVALKWILRDTSANHLRRLVREARAAGMVRHPNIVDVYDVGEHEGSLFLVMELLEGEALRDLIDREAPLAPGPLLGLLLPAFRGVRTAHRKGVIHRDLKPANVFVCVHDGGEAPNAKILDFGISKITTDGIDDDPTLTDGGAPVGTPSYMAPEQLSEPHEVDARADIYACGVLLYHALSGRRPFEAENHAALAVKVLALEPAPLEELRPELPPALCAAIRTAMNKRAAERFADMGELIAALEPFADAEARPRVQRAGSSRFFGRTKPAFWLALALMIALGLAFGRRSRTVHALRHVAQPSLPAPILTARSGTPVEDRIVRPGPSLRVEEPAPESVVASPPPAPGRSLARRAKKLHRDLAPEPGVETSTAKPAAAAHASGSDAVIELNPEEF